MPPTPPRHRTDEARAILVRLADLVGFPRPTPEQGLAEWADTCLDGTLLRGAAPWQVAHAHVLSALEASLLSGEAATMARASMILARDAAKAGAGWCPYAEHALVATVEQHGKKWCTQCHRRRGP